MVVPRREPRLSNVVSGACWYLQKLINTPFAVRLVPLVTAMTLRDSPYYLRLLAQIQIPPLHSPQTPKYMGNIKLQTIYKQINVPDYEDGNSKTAKSFI